MVCTWFHGRIHQAPNMAVVWVVVVYTTLAVTVGILAPSRATLLSSSFTQPTKGIGGNSIGASCNPASNKARRFFGR